ncbi:hypothetical protein BSYN_22250 [Bacteroides sedimenti]|uniref:Uncharacterized protein n=1 Tax=Bacteroides sedimenti TaxID=2136147 RepID=A0ABM8IIM2_9BACE
MDEVGGIGVIFYFGIMGCVIETAKQDLSGALSLLQNNEKSRKIARQMKAAFR